jgi:hypothetical protein
MKLCHRVWASSAPRSGWKTDVNVSAWIADLLAHGPIGSSFVPEQEIQESRELLRTRKQPGRQQSSHIKRAAEDLRVESEFCWIF